MKISGSNVVEHPVERVWEALLDPRVLVATIPGCERLESTGENAYAMTVTAGVAAIKGTYTGSCALSKLEPHESLVMTLNGAGGVGAVPVAAGPAAAVTEPGAPLVGAPAYAEPVTGAGVFTAASAAGGGDAGELTRGIGIGAAVALLGVLVGAVIGRRR